MKEFSFNKIFLHYKVNFLRSVPPYFAYLAPSDFHLSRYLQESLRGRAFADDEVIIMAIDEWIEEQDQNFFCKSVKALQQKWEKSVDLRRNCV